MTRTRDLLGFAATILTTVVYLYATLPGTANASVLPPPEPPKRQVVVKDQVLPLQPGDVIIRVPHALRPQHPYSPLPDDWKERRKDPQSWA